MKIRTTDLNLPEHQFVPQAVVAYDATPELCLLPPHRVVKQRPFKRRGHGTQDLNTRNRKQV